MMRCLRCGDETPRTTVDQIHCPRCEREVRILTAAKSEPDFIPPWRRRLRAKEMPLGTAL